MIAWMAAPVFALAASLPVSLVEFKHDAWTIESGAPSRINAITQTGDGFLWIGSVEGLFRFDGVTFEPVKLAASQPQRLVVSSLLAARSGDLWVGLGRGRGLARFRDGQLQDAQMPHPSREVNDLAEDPEGGLWVARGGRSDRLLARFHDERWQELGPESGLTAQPVWHLHFARDGTMWVVQSTTLAFRRPGETRFSRFPITVTPRASLSEDARGQLWISDAKGTRPLHAAARPASFFAHPNPVGGTRQLFDRHGDLWTTTWNSGVLRIRAPDPGASSAKIDDGRRVASLNATAGLTSDQTRALFQDREGNLWVGTELGLDLLRPASVIVEPDLPANSPTSYRMAATRDGTVYVADAHALYAMVPGQKPRRVLTSDTPAEALCAAGEHGVWLFLGDRVLRVDAGVVTRHVKPAGATAYGCAEDGSGRLWMPGLERGLHWWRDGVWQRWPEPEPSPSLPANAALDREGRAVVLFRGPPPQGLLPFLALNAANPLVGGIEGLLPSEAGVLASGSRGMAQAEGSSGSLLSQDDHPWAVSLNGLAQTPDGQTWAIGDAGIVQLRSSDLADALRRPGTPLPHRIYDFQDGLNSFVQKAPGAQVAVGGDGRVWFLTRRNVMRVDPASLSPNRLKPPVLIRSIQVGDQTFAAASRVTLPAGTTTVRMVFTALSLTVPGRVQFRHRLVGESDAAWSAPSRQRTALLSDLGPGTYRFEVLACNNDGEWADHPAEVTLTIPATFTQSGIFKLGVAALTLLALYGLYLARLRQILARIRERSEERLQERERIARDIHDTLLQSVQALILRFHAVTGRLNGDPSMQQALNQALDRAEAVLVEGRDRLQGLRRVGAVDLENEVRRLIAEQPFAAGTQFSVSSTGERRGLRSNVFDEILCIVGEALFNAARHAHASEVTVQIDYGRQWLEIGIRDNGVGMPQDTAARAGAAGHFGMLGMRERAKRIDAQFGVEANGDANGHAGTRVWVRIKARVAYARDVS
ncbi:sensor histidine kinase [Roseateles amylovorans]|uniref:Histidine kinase n=1 Tax=Roseateles amylovorans TaxID=2978473 RepID=A0ABY6AW95_9BURK|nr:sensor histidine kinase [Roseateles amylovorans]UXH76039.1 histidine kinase [Roseateles amylovorans]